MPQSRVSRSSSFSAGKTVRMYIQSNHSVVASVHVFWFLSFCMFLLFCWTEGAAGLPTNTSNADIRGCRRVKTAAPPRGFIPSGLTQPSIGEKPHCIARVPAGIALPLFGSVVYQSHRKSIEDSGLASRPAQLYPSLNPYRQPTAPRSDV